MKKKPRAAVPALALAQQAHSRHGGGATGLHPRACRGTPRRPAWCPELCAAFTICPSAPEPLVLASPQGKAGTQVLRRHSRAPGACNHPASLSNTLLEGRQLRRPAAATAKRGMPNALSVPAPPLGLLLRPASRVPAGGGAQGQAAAAALPAAALPPPAAAHRGRRWRQPPLRRLVVGLPVALHRHTTSHATAARLPESKR